MENAMNIEVEVCPVDPSSLPLYTSDAANHNDAPALELRSCLRAEENTLRRLGFDTVQVTFRGIYCSSSIAPFH